MTAAPQTSLERLLDHYDRFLLDAYGVLVDDQGPLPGAIDFIAELHQRDKPRLILTNSASRLPEGILSTLRDLGFALELEHILSSGMLLPDYFTEHGLVDAPSAQVAHVAKIVVMMGMASVGLPGSGFHPVGRRALPSMNRP